jgi:hypothetical protein
VTAPIGTLIFTPSEPRNAGWLVGQRRSILGGIVHKGNALLAETYESF